MPARRFCGSCGAEVAVARATAQRAAAERADSRARLGAVGVLFAGALGALLVQPQWARQDETLAMLSLLGTQIVVGFAALGWIGWRRWRATLGRAPSLTGCALAVPAAAISLAFAVGYVSLLAEAMSELGADPTRPELLAAVFVIALVPCCEEWLCRGVLWIAVGPLTSRSGTLLLTATLFAFLHGLNGAYLLELPHRFVLGLLCGALRARTGSLAPAVLTHALHNAGAVVWSW